MDLSKKKAPIFNKIMEDYALDAEESGKEIDKQLSLTIKKLKSNSPSLDIPKSIQQSMDGTLPGTLPTIDKGKSEPSLFSGDTTVRNRRNNNPGNIKVSSDKWDGAIGSDAGGDVASGSFVKFKSPEYGVRALAKDITTKRKRGVDTIEKILKVYAPDGKENNTSNYINSVVKTTGIAKNKKLSDKDMFNIVKAISLHEGDNVGNDRYFNDDILKKGLRMAGY